MNFTPYVDYLRYELTAAADGYGHEARELADRLAGPLESAARFALLGAVSAAMGEVNRRLAPGSVAIRLRGLDPEFEVTPPPWSPLTEPVVLAPPVHQACLDDVFRVVTGGPDPTDDPPAPA
ncbi:hypothetical protein SYYSPA8_32730 [Streptomyces yaizuensis]|uniref:Uncharacterized protein n=1 Tax=Streptomyces yaizuensis TaxID=2989713 RepID=A0ABQ5P9B9_9ACTN|nr:hypothetical protein SYYSPA8_32730 [Streptomyces sp. YSPA8]